jgi:monoamine oxidase
MYEGQLDYLKVLREGLSEPRTKKRVVIVGAGMAGLTAAALLKHAGHTVTILEAQKRIGGRVHTYRSFDANMYGELGAMRFPRKHVLVQHLIAKYGLETKPFSMGSEENFVFINDKRVKTKDFKARTFGFELKEDELDVAPATLLKTAMAPLFTVMDDPDETLTEDHRWDTLLDQFDRYSLLGFLRERTTLSDAAIAMLGLLQNMEGRFQFSLVEWFAHYYDDVMSELEYVVEGADCVPRCLAADSDYGLAEHIFQDADVQAIDHKADSETVRVTYKSASGVRHDVIADECVITSPISLLRHMEIGGLDLMKEYALRNCYYGRAHKIFMQFDDRWWHTTYGIEHGATTTDLAARNIVYTPAGQDPSGKQGVLIASYGWE